MRNIFHIVSVVAALIAGPVVAQTSPVVVELYTSQGCSSCPPADALLQELAAQPDVIALALHVDYWDYIGWKDAFADPAYTRRQHGYAQAAGASTVYTPQMVIAGVDHVIGSKPMAVRDAIRAAARRPSPVALQITRSGGTVHIAATAASATGPLAVQVVRYTPQESVAIERGENAGRTIMYANIVRKWEMVAQWDGASPLALDYPAAGNDPLVVIVQQNGFGPILAAAQLR